LKLEIEKDARLAIAGALVGALLGAIGTLVYARARNTDESAGEHLAEVKTEVLSIQRVAALAWAAITLVREILDFGKGE
jgi:hypothetical protein